MKIDNLLLPGWECRDALDFIIEGIQIIDFDWRYLYVNKSVAEHGGMPKSELLGFTVMEKYPGIENTFVFNEMRQCMSDRQPRHLENEFTFPDHSRKCFELKIEPIDEGIRIISLDITKQKRTDAKLHQINHFYSFLRHVNQKIVRVSSEEDLFDNACHLAIEYGKFKMAWIGLFDAESKTINLTSQEGVPSEDLDNFENVLYQASGPQDHVLRTGSYYICNDIKNSPELETWKPFSSKHDILSCIVLPIRKFGIIVGTLNLYSGELHFSDTEEIALLVELANDISFALELFEKAKIHAETEKSLVQNEMLFRHTLESMLEGAQIHDFNWNYTYVNDAAVSYSPYLREELIGFTLMEKYPGIEQTDLFKTMERCMNCRQSEHLETDFVFPDSSVKHFEFSIQPIPEGIFILSVDRTDRHKTNEKLLKVTRLYAFNSAINQSIVHISDEKELLQNACKVATEIGGFKMAWIGMFDRETETINLIEQNGIADEELPLFINAKFSKSSPTSRVQRSGMYYNCVDIKTDPLLKSWRPFAARHGIQSGIVLPIRKGGTVIGTFNLYSSRLNFADEEEIILLEEVTGDISFALDIFEKTKKHDETEALVIANEKKFRALIEKSPDMKTLSNNEAKLVYGSPAVTKTLGFSEQEFLGKSILDFIHQDCISYFMEKRTGILNKPGASFQFKMPLIHKEGNWIWCEGTVTNMMHESGVEAFVANFTDITDKKIAEDQKEFDQNNLDALINNTNDLMWSVDTNMNLITSNRPFDEMTLQVNNQIIEKGANILFGATTGQTKRFKEYYERAFSGEVFKEIEYSASPVEYYSEISYYPIRKGDEIIGTACHSRDITERKVMEENLIQSESRLKESQAIGHIGNWEVKLAHNIHTWSDEYYKIFGVEKNDVHPSIELFYTFFHPEDIDFSRKKIEKSFETHKADSLSFRFIRNDGSTRHGYSEWKFEFDKNNTPIRMYGILQDVTEAKAAEKRIRQSEFRLKESQTTAQLGSWELDFVTGIGKWSEETCRIYGLPTDQNKQNYESWKSFLHPDDLEYVMAVMTESEMKLTDTAFDHRIVLRDGTIKHIHSKFKFNLDKNGKPLAMYGIAQDVTDRKMSELKLEQQNKELVKTNFELDRFVYSVSHDLRSPLTAILGLTTFIEEETNETDTLEHAKMIKGRILRLDEFIKNILSYSRNNRLGLQIKRIEIHQEITDIVTMLCSAKNTEGIRFEINIDEQQPFYSDAQSLNTVVENLISNAIKFRKPDHLKNTISITGISDSEYLTLNIADNGIGIAPENHQKIFEMFYRLSGAVDGSGIGLYIAKEIVEKLQGTIEIESTLGIGTVFHIKIKNLQHYNEHTNKI